MAPLESLAAMGVSSTSNPASDLIFSVVYVCGTVGFFALGVAMVRHPDAFARFFTGFGSRMFGRQLAVRTYRARNMKIAGWGFVLFAPLLTVLGVVAIVSHLG